MELARNLLTDFHLKELQASLQTSVTILYALAYKSVHFFLGRTFFLVYAVYALYALYAKIVRFLIFRTKLDEKQRFCVYFVHDVLTLILNSNTLTELSNLFKFWRYPNFSQIDHLNFAVCNRFSRRK